MYVGLERRGTIFARMIKAPEKIPAQPRPAMARPTIRPTLEGVAAQSSEPISKIPIEVMKTHLIEKVE
jgi:hypothetical protein